MGKTKKNKKPDNVIVQNRKARFDYEILDTFEAGLVLTGSEVKALREGKGNINEAYAVVTGGELWLLNASIAPYSNASTHQMHEERRTRKILMHKKEIQYLSDQREKDGLTLVPLQLHWKRGKVKVLVGVGKGKKKFDKRETIKRREWGRQQRAMLKHKVR